MSFDEVQGLQLGRYLADCAAYPLPRRAVLHRNTTVVDYGEYILFARQQNSFALDHPIMCEAIRALFPCILSVFEVHALLAADGTNYAASTTEFCLRLLARNQVLIEAAETDTEFSASELWNSQTLLERLGFAKLQTGSLFSISMLPVDGDEMQLLLLELSELPKLSNDQLRKQAVIAVHTGHELFITHHKPGSQNPCIKCFLMRLRMLTNTPISRIQRFHRRHGAVTPSADQLNALAGAFATAQSGGFYGFSAVSAHGDITFLFPLPVPNCEFCREPTGFVA